MGRKERVGLARSGAGARVRRALAGRVRFLY